MRHLKELEWRWSLAHMVWAVSGAVVTWVIALREQAPLTFALVAGVLVGALVLVGATALRKWRTPQVGLGGGVSNEVPPLRAATPPQQTQLADIRLSGFFQEGVGLAEAAHDIPREDLQELQGRVSQWVRSVSEYLDRRHPNHRLEFGLGFEPSEILTLTRDSLRGRIEARLTVLQSIVHAVNAAAISASHKRSTADPLRFRPASSVVASQMRVGMDLGAAEARRQHRARVAEVVRELRDDPDWLAAWASNLASLFDAYDARHDLIGHEDKYRLNITSHPEWSVVREFISEFVVGMAEELHDSPEPEVEGAAIRLMLTEDLQAVAEFADEFQPDGWRVRRSGFRSGGRPPLPNES